MDDNDEFTTITRDAATFIQVLSDDVEQAIKVVNAEDSPYTRRALVRAVFAAVEGITYDLKQICLKFSKVIQPDPPYTDAEMAMLREESYEVDDKGRAHTRTGVKFIPIQANFRFALQMYSRLTGADLILDLCDGGWESFKKSLEVRHRITHPKKLADFAISDQEMGVIREAAGWCFGTYVANTRSGQAAFDARRARLLKDMEQGQAQPPAD
jgi:hypothetical protein